MHKTAFACILPALLWAPCAFAADSKDPDVPTAALPNVESPAPPSDAVAEEPHQPEEAVPSPHTPPAPPPGAVSPFRVVPPTRWSRPGEPASSWAAPSYSPMPDATQSDVSEPETRREWYGWQTLLTDAGSILLIATAIGSGEGELALVGTAGFFAGAPVVHAAHGHSGKAWGSFGLRAGASVGLALVGYGLAGGGSCEGDLCGVGEGILAGAGLIIGATTAIVIDAAVIANEDVKIERPQAAKFTIAPSVAVTPKGALTGLMGTF